MPEKEKNMKNEQSQAETRYGAFISYRHVPEDMRIAERLQRFLETYRAPKGSAQRRRIGRVFRDRDELPTSSDLQESLRRALLNSDYLVILLSETTKDSKYCMEELRLFREAHGGRTDHILPVLVSGEPDDVIPDLLRREERTEVQPDGSVRRVITELEPLCCDMRATDGKRRKENAEFLRIAAPILGCGYDSLYRRQRKRQRTRRAVAAGAALAVLAAVLAVVLVSYSRVIQAYDQVAASERQTKAALMNNYVRTAQAESLSGEPARALAYYAYVLGEDPDNADAKAGALLELQKYGWLAEESAEEAEPEQTPAAPEALTAFGKMIQEPDSTRRFYAAMNDSAIRVWIPETDTTYEIENRKEDGSPFKGEVSVLPVAVGGKICLALFDYDMTTELNLYEAFPDRAEGGIVPCGRTRTLSWSELHEPFGTSDWDYAYGSYKLWADGEAGLLLVNEGGGLTLVSLPDGEVLAGTMLDAWVADVLFAPDGSGLAVVNSSTTGANLDHRITFYNLRLSIQAYTDPERVYRYCHAEYTPDGRSVLWATGGSVCLVNAYTGKPRTAKVICPGIRTAAADGNGRIIAADAAGVRHTWRVVGPYIAAAPAEESREAEGVRIAAAGEERKRVTLEYENSYLVRTVYYLELRDGEGNILDEAFREQVEAFENYEELYYQHYAAVSPDGQTAVIWGESTDGQKVNAFHRFTIDGEAGKLREERIEIPEEYRNSIETMAVNNGVCAVRMTGGVVLVYRNGSAEPDSVILAGNGNDRTFHNISVGEEGYVAFESSEIYVVSHSETGIIPHWDEMDSTRTLELWKGGAHVANLFDRVSDMTLIADKITFAEDGSLCFSYHDSRDPDFRDEVAVTRRLTAPDPDEQALEALRSITCWRMTPQGELAAQTPAYAGEAGTWQEIFP